MTEQPTPKYDDAMTFEELRSNYDTLCAKLDERLSWFPEIRRTRLASLECSSPSPRRGVRRTGGKAMNTRMDSVVQEAVDKAAVPLVAQIRRQRTELSDLRAACEAKQAELEAVKEDYLHAANCIARMHSAATGGAMGPKRGVVEDMEDVRAELAAKAAECVELRKDLDAANRWIAQLDERLDDQKGESE